MSSYLPPWRKPPIEHPLENFATDEAEGAKLFINAAYSSAFRGRIMRLEERSMKKNGYTAFDFILRCGNSVAVFVKGDDVKFQSRFYRKNRLTKNGRWHGKVSDLKGE